MCNETKNYLKIGELTRYKMVSSSTPLGLLLQRIEDISIVEKEQESKILILPLEENRLEPVPNVKCGMCNRVNKGRCPATTSPRTTL